MSIIRTAPRRDCQPFFPAPRAKEHGKTLTEQFLAFDAQHPYVYRALERLTAERLAAGATRVGLKSLFESLRAGSSLSVCVG